MTARIQMEDIVKDFPGVRALDHVNFSAKAGEVLALCGENGAGKSTLMKILSGVYQPDEGRILVNGKAVKFPTTTEAEEAGITIIHQELNLFHELSVAENIFAGSWKLRGAFIDWSKIRTEAKALLDEIGVNIDPNTKLANISVGMQQMVEIAKALSKRSQIIIFDEPTTALSHSEARSLFKIINKLKTEGKTIIYISHKMEEIQEIADRVGVLRDGASIGEVEPIAQMPTDKIIEKMVGRSLKELFPKPQRTRGEKIMEVKNFYVQDPERAGAWKAEDISFDLYKGELLGIYGLMGSGRSELCYGIFGALPDLSEGKVLIAGKSLKIRNTHDAIRSHIGLVSEDRKHFGLVLGRNIIENVSLASLRQISKHAYIQAAEEKQKVEKHTSELKLKAASLNTEVRYLSGGNQQKVVLAKWLMMKPRVLLLDEPTKGVDVGAKIEIYQIINQLLEQGIGVLMVSSDLPEVMGLSDRVIVMREGRIAADKPRDQINEEKVMEYATIGQA